MKKGFTMIELIFVIVILGILASVAIPRLASTRQDAEISAAIANLRTLQSDASAYYVANGSFPDNFKAMTNVKLENEFGDDTFGLYGSLKVGADAGCIPTTLKNEIKDSFFQPAVMMIDLSGTSDDPLCQAVKETPEVQKFTQNDIYEQTCDKDGKNCKKTFIGKGILIGSSTSVY